MKKTFTIFLCASFLSCPVWAQDGAKAEYSAAKFIAGDKKNDIGLDIAMSDGWYTYWRMPGDNGLAPKFDWSKSRNVKSVDILWPAPSRFTVMDMHSFGYRNHVFLPMTVTPENPGEPVSLDLKLDLVVCHEICVPQNLYVSGDSMVEEKAMWKDAKKSLPQKENSDDLGITAAVLGKDSLVVTAYAKGGFHKDADLIVETPFPLLTAPPQILVDEKDESRAVLKIFPPAGVDLTKELFGKEATIVLVHGEKSLERDFSF